MRFGYQQYRTKSPVLPGGIVTRPEIPVKVIGPSGLVLGHSGFLDYSRATFDGLAKELEVQITPAFAGTSGQES